MVALQDNEREKEKISGYKSSSVEQFEAVVQCQFWPLYRYSI